MKIYQGDRGSGKTTKLIELCGRDGILVVFCAAEKMRIKRLSPSTRCLTFDELRFGRDLGLSGDFYFDNLLLMLRQISDKIQFITMDGELICLSDQLIDPNLFVSKNGKDRDVFAVNTAIRKDCYIVCNSHSDAYRLSQDSEFIIRFPLSYDELLDGLFNPYGVKSFCVHDAHILLGFLARGKRIQALSI
jgi:hypothetical protein